MKMLQLTDSRVQEAIVLYKSGMAVRPICQKLKMDTETLRRFLIQENLLRTRAEAVQIGRLGSKVNHEVLDLLLPEALYWIGFLYTDGHIEKSRPRISVTVSSIDKDHLEKMIQFFGEGLTLRTLGSGHVRVSFSSKRIYERLISLGFNNRKTYDITPHESLKGSRDFWRGCVDGDGWIFKDSVKTIGLCGHQNTVREFLRYLNLTGIETKTQERKDKRREHLWKCDLHHNKAVEVATLLYKDSTVYLNRKFEKYKELTKNES